MWITTFALVIAVTGLVFAASLLISYCAMDYGRDWTAKPFRSTFEDFAVHVFAIPFLTAASIGFLSYMLVKHWHGFPENWPHFIAVIMFGCGGLFGSSLAARIRAKKYRKIAKNKALEAMLETPKALAAGAN